LQHRFKDWADSIRTDRDSNSLTGIFDRPVDNIHASKHPSLAFCSGIQMSDELNNKQEAVLNAEEHRIAIDRVVNAIRPALQRDGGDCEVVDVSPDGKTVFMKLKGACSHCPSAIYTLKFGIEQTLREMVPGVETVEQVW